jgi:molybdopterin-containing oxidoreductase family membrane subunit
MSRAIVLGRPSDRELTDALIAPATSWSRTMKWLFVLSGAGTLVFLAAAAYTMLTGIGVWGNNVPVGWGFGIVNFVWWIGIGHAGTFVSAILLLLEQKWRTSINRFAETMTLFALVQAAIYPLLHLGRPWFIYWLLPYPSTMGVWPQFKSPLTWDAAAVSTYATVSLLFWYVGLIPDLATLRDRATTRARAAIYGTLSLGWRGSSREWRHHKAAQLILAGLATPLVLSVHSVVSTDFAVSVLPGWHSTMFPPYFVAGAIFSGFAMVVTLVIPARRAFRLQPIITPRHLDLIGKLLLTTGLIVAYAYLFQVFLAWYGQEPFEERMHLETRPFGTYAWLYWLMLACNVGVIQALWWRRVRVNELALFAIAFFVNVGMWLERFVLIVTSQHRDFLPSSTDVYLPSVIDAALFFGTLCFFLFLFLLALRFIPFIPVAELREMNRELEPEERADG